MSVAHKITEVNDFCWPRTKEEKEVRSLVREHKKEIKSPSGCFSIFFFVLFDLSFVLTHFEGHLKGNFIKVIL
jgi:hypothetical protein